MTITLTILRDNRAQLHMLCEALGLSVADLDLSVFDDESLARWYDLADKDIRSYINGDQPAAIAHPLNKELFATVVKRPYPDKPVLRAKHLPCSISPKHKKHSANQRRRTG